MQLSLLLTGRGGLGGDVVTNGRSDQETAPGPERSEEGKRQGTGPALSQSKFLLFQEDGRQDLMGDSSKEQRSSRGPSGL